MGDFVLGKLETLIQPVEKFNLYIILMKGLKGDKHER